ncbi:MAG: hypothetical protein GXO25_03025 [Euryarchaeota archaeon]|nr:hypothetical protein [Euryarchaeota archaeon]
MVPAAASCQSSGYVSHVPGDESTSGDVFLQVSLSKPESSAFEKVDVELDDYANRTGTGGYLNLSGEMLLELEGHNYTVRVLDMDKNGVLSSGDRIEKFSDTGTPRISPCLCGLRAMKEMRSSPYLRSFYHHGTSLYPNL